MIQKCTTCLASERLPCGLITISNLILCPFSVKCIRSVPAYFAETLYYSMKVCICFFICHFPSPLTIVLLCICSSFLFHCKCQQGIVLLSIYKRFGVCRSGTDQFICCFLFFPSELPVNFSDHKYFTENISFISCFWPWSCYNGKCLARFTEHLQLNKDFIAFI